MLRFFTIFKASLLFSTCIYGNCTFKTGDFIEEINNPAFIKSIDVEVPQSAKFNRNFAKILVSKSKNIPQKLKKNFNSIVTVVYEFGSCSFKAKVKQTGDWKDHISLADSGQPLRSLNVRLEEGNVLNAVRFKLLIPETRGNLNEVFATVLMRKLGFIAPETFAVKTSINGSSSTMLFQEDARKELLEKSTLGSNVEDLSKRLTSFLLELAILLQWKLSILQKMQYSVVSQVLHIKISSMRYTRKLNLMSLFIPLAMKTLAL